MYPLKIALIGCRESVLLDVQRELSNLSAEAQDVCGQLSQWAEHLLPQRDEQRLLITQPRSAEDVQQMARLNEFFSGQPMLALVDPNDDPSLMVRAMRAGAAQVVRVPLQPDDFAEAMQRIAIQFGCPLQRSQLIAVAGASEGSGATTLAIHIAAEMAAVAEARCIVTEGSVQFGKLASQLAVEPNVTLYDLLCDPERLDGELVHQSLTKVTDNLQMVVGSYQEIAPLEVRSQDLLRVLTYLRDMADYVVVDMPYNFNTTYFDVLASAQQIVLVGEPTVPSFRDMTMFVDRLQRDAPASRRVIVLNRFDASEPVCTADRLRELVKTVAVHTVTDEPSAFHLAQNSGRLLTDVAPYAAACNDIRALACALLGREDKSSQSSWNLLNTVSHLAHALHLK